MLDGLQASYGRISSAHPPVALRGARQAGKTTLARTLAAGTDSVYLDLEVPGDLLKPSDPESYPGSYKDKLIILDEIQRSPDLFMVLRGLIDENRQEGRKTAQFLLLGSASMDLLRQPSERLAGRISHVEMGGLNMLESGHGRECLNRLWLRGGFPDSYLADTDDMAMYWLEDLVRTYAERDVPQMDFRVPAGRLRRLWTMLAHLQGEPVNTSRLAGNLEIQRPAVNH